MIRLNRAINELFKEKRKISKSHSPFESIEIFQKAMASMAKDKWFGRKSALIIPARIGLSGLQAHGTLDSQGAHAYPGNPEDKDKLIRAAAAFAEYYALIVQSPQGASKAVNQLTKFELGSHVHVLVDKGTGAVSFPDYGNWKVTEGKGVSQLRVNANHTSTLPILVDTTFIFQPDFEKLTKGWSNKKGGTLNQRGAVTDQLTRRELESFNDIEDQEGSKALGSGYAFACLGRLTQESGLAHYYYCPSVLSYTGDTEGSPPGVLIIATWEELSPQEIGLFEMFSNAVWGAITSLELIAKRREAIQSAMRAGVSRVQGRSLSHGIGSGTLQKLAVPGELRKAVGRDPNIPNAPPRDHASDLAQLLRAANEALCSPMADLDRVRELLAGAERVLSEQCVMNAKAEEELRHMFRVVKDRMELLSQVATVRSGLLETWSVRAMVDLYNKSDMLVRPMVREGLFSKLLFQQSSDLKVGVVEGRIGVSGALFTLLDGIIRNVSRHTDGNACVFRLEAARETEWPLVRLEVHHPWQTRGRVKKFEVIQKNLDDDTLDASGAVRRYAWGIMEQKQVCAFLRELDMTEVDKPHMPRLLTITRYRDEKKNWWLKHVFYMPQPRSLLKVSKNADGTVVGQDESGLEIKKDDWGRYTIACLDSNIAAPVENAPLPMRTVILGSGPDRSGSEVWNAYVVQCLRGSRGVRLNLFNHDRLERTVCFGDQTAPLVVAVHDHQGLDPGKYQRIAEQASGELVMLHAMGSTTSFGELFREMKNGTELGKAWCARMAEAGTTPIVILDERVQEEAWPTDGHPHGTALEAMGVFVPDLKATGDLKATTPDKVNAFFRKLETERSWIKEVPKRYLIIHRSVMQRLNSVGTADAYPQRFKDAGYTVRIVSGAAGGSEISMGVDPYVSLAGLEEHAIRIPCKWQLSDMVITARNQPKQP